MAEEVRLAPLTLEETALVTTLILDTGLPAPRDVVAAVFERTDGVPLHIEELLGALSAEARADGTAIRQATVPATIEDAVIARIAQRSPEAQAAARAGAVIGRCFVPEVLAGIMDVPPEALDAPLQELVDSFVLDPPGLRGLYDFRHQLLRDALYRTIPTWERRRFHARAGSSAPSSRARRRSMRRSITSAPACAGRRSRRALAGARDAARLSAHREAFELYRRAVANLPDELDDADRGALLEAYADEAARDRDERGRGAGLPRRPGRLPGGGTPGERRQALADVLGVWRRQARSVVERSELAAALLHRAGAAPSRPGRLEISSRRLTTSSTRIHLETHRSIAARATTEALRGSATALEGAADLLRRTPFTAMVDVLDGRVAEGLDGTRPPPSRRSEPASRMSGSPRSATLPRWPSGRWTTASRSLP